MSFLNNIHRMQLTNPVDLTFTTDNKVKKIYQANYSGDLISIEFTLEGDKVRLCHQTTGGQLYIKFSKKQK